MDLTLMAANQVGVNIIKNITDAEIASIKAKGEIERSKMRMAHLDEMEAIEAQNERNRTHKKLRASYKEMYKNYPLERQRMYHTFLIKTKIKEKIENVLSGYVVRKSSNETYDNIFNGYLNKDKPITNALLGSEKSPKEA